MTKDSVRCEPSKNCTVAFLKPPNGCLAISFGGPLPKHLARRPLSSRDFPIWCRIRSLLIVTWTTTSRSSSIRFPLRTLRIRFETSLAREQPPIFTSSRTSKIISVSMHLRFWCNQLQMLALKQKLR